MIALKEFFNKINPKDSSTQPLTVDQILVKQYDGQDRWVAAASYLYFVSAAILVIRRDNSEFVIVHCRQAFLLLLGAILSFVFLPGIWKFIANGGILCLNLFGAYQAYRGFKWNIPYLTDIANSIET